MDSKKKGGGKTESFVRHEQGIMMKQLGYKREFLGPNHVRVTVPTLPFEGLDQSDFGCIATASSLLFSGKKMLPWSILHLSKSCDVRDFWPVQETDSDIDNISLFYMLNIELNVEYSFYILDSPKFPLILDHRVKFVKRSSRSIETTLRHPSIYTPYVVISTIDVNVDPVSRMPKPFPSWWKERFHFPNKGERREFKLPPKPSDGVFTSQHRVAFTDTDEKKHANYSVYVRISYNSMCENILAGNYGAGLDVYEIGLKTLQITYLNECGLGDTLTVLSWASSEKEHMFYFELYNVNVLCATLSMSFYNMLDVKCPSNL